ncbi:hypothetical protein ACVWZV_002234 [Bradyrhizobium sp. GM5.1]
MTEIEIQAAICDYLAFRKVFFWRSNNTPIYDRTRNAFRRMPKYALHGIPDIIVIRDGRFIGIEVKRANGTLSEHQVEFERSCLLAGGQYLVARSIDDVIAFGL